MLPNSVVPFVESWHVSLKDWMFLWWTDDDLEWLLHTHYTQYAKSYSRMPHYIIHNEGGYRPLLYFASLRWSLC
jgi:hypothetical protein